MRHVEYAEFDLLVQRAGDGFEARVLQSPTGETGMVPIRVPFSALELENFLLKIGRPRAAAVRGMGSPESAAIRDFGGRLYEGVFRGDLRDRLVSSLNQAEERGVGLRLRLRLADCPELADLPWECLYDPVRRRHFALSGWTPLVRYPDQPGLVRPLEVTPPLRVLVVIASPTDYPRLNVEREFENLHQALDSLTGARQLVIDRLPAGTLAALQQQLRREDYHIVHYVGHGGYDSAADDGMLVFEGPTGRGQQVSGQDLATLLCDYRTLRLVVLNSCQGARGGLTDPYAGTAQTLIHQGMPAVIAMQFEITDEAAIAFSHAFYAALADGYPVEAATTEARKTVRNSPNAVEWATPALYLRASDGHLFTFTTPSPAADAAEAARNQASGRAGAADTSEARAQQQLAHRYEMARRQLKDRAWEQAIDTLSAIGQERPGYRDTAALLAAAKQSAAHPTKTPTYVPEPRTLQIGHWVHAVAFSPDGTRLATGATRRVQVWDLRVGAKLWEQQVGRWTEPVRAVAFSPDGTRLAGDVRKTGRIWDATTGEQQLQVTHTRGVGAVAFSPDGTRLATGSNDKTARIWDATTGEQQLQVTHPSRVTEVAFSPDGTRLAAGSGDAETAGTAQIWDASTGELQVVITHTSWVGAVAFSPDGTRLATGGGGGVVRIWDATTGQKHHTVARIDTVYAVAFSPDGTRLATGSTNGTVQIWDADLLD